MNNPKEAPSFKPINIEELLRSQRPPADKAEPNPSTPVEKVSGEESGGIRQLIELPEDTEDE